MLQNVVIEQGVADSFKSNMQGSFDFLVDCAKSIDDCKIVEELGFDGGYMSNFNSSINQLEGTINNILSTVTNCENDLFQEDQSGTERIETVFDNEDSAQKETPVVTTEKENKPDIKDKTYKAQADESQVASDTTSETHEDNTKTDMVTQASNNEQKDEHVTGKNTTRETHETTANTATTSNRNGTTGNTYSRNNSGSTSSYASNDESSYTPTPSNTDTSTPFKFNIDKEMALSIGDIFINDRYSLTEYTNYLLYKYNIKDENVAKMIYQSMIKYGNDYYSKYQKNPIKEVAEKEILSVLYNDMRNLISNSNENTFWNLLKDVKL